MNANEESTIAVNRVMTTAHFLTVCLLMMTTGVPLTSDLSVSFDQAVYSTAPDGNDVVEGPGT